jgi:HPt (histidine-containing phosphotransfer) domain-containing protein
MDDHLSKPFTPEALLAVVTHAAAARGAGGKADVVAGDVASMPTATPALPPPDAETAILDNAVFERTAAFLAPEAVASCLRTIAERCETLLCALGKPGALAGQGPDLAAAAHVLAGSAGMFGFGRLAATARCFEFAVQSGTPDAQAVTDNLTAALESSLDSISSRQHAIVVAASAPEQGTSTSGLAAASV